MNIQMDVRWYLAKGMKILLNPPAMNNCNIHKLSRVGARCDLSGVTLGRYSYIGHNSFMVNTVIGAFCSLGERCIAGGNAPCGICIHEPCFCQGAERY